MTIRKHRQPTPHFKLPHPFQPITGERARLQVGGVSPYCAMMQVAAEDTLDDYVLCRGFDIRIPKFVNYDANDLTNNPGIPVAKPYAYRMPGIYKVGQIYAAFLPLQIGVPSPVEVLWRVGQNPGVSSTTQGHPADLSEEVEILYTTAGEVINWFMVETPVESVTLVELCLAEDHPGRGTAFNAYEGVWNPATDGWDYTCGDTVKAIDWRYGVPYPDAGTRGLFTPRISTTYKTIYECVSMDCESPGDCC